MHLALISNVARGKQPHGRSCIFLTCHIYCQPPLLPRRPVSSAVQAKRGSASGSNKLRPSQSAQYTTLRGTVGGSYSCHTKYIKADISCSCLYIWQRRMGRWGLCVADGWYLYSSRAATTVSPIGSCDARHRPKRRLVLLAWPAGRSAGIPCLIAATRAADMAARLGCAPTAAPMGRFGPGTLGSRGPIAPSLVFLDKPLRHARQGEKQRQKGRFRRQPVQVPSNTLQQG